MKLTYLDVSGSGNRALPKNRHRSKQHNCTGETMLKIFKGCTEFYGNGNVYLTSGDDVQKLEKHNFEVKALRNEGDEIWINTGLIVAIGVECEPSDAVRQLKHVLRSLEREAARVGDAKKCPICSAADEG